MAEEYAETPRPIPLWRKWLVRVILLAIIATPIVLWPVGVAAVVAGLAIFCILIYWWVCWKIRKFLAPLQNLDLFPTEIKLTAVKSVKWHHADLVEADERVFGERGFQKIGCFTGDKVPGTTLSAFLKEDLSTFGVIYDTEFMKVWSDLIVAFEDGSYITITNSPLPDPLGRPPDKPQKRFPGASLSALFETHREEYQGKPLRRLSADDFVPLVEKYVREVKQWQVDSAHKEQSLKQELREAFLRESKWSAIEWDRNHKRVIFIYDGMSNANVVESFIEALCIQDEQGHGQAVEKARVLSESRPARKAFALMVQEIPRHRPFEKLAVLKQPFEVDVYLAPEGPEVEEEED